MKYHMAAEPEPDMDAVGGGVRGVAGGIAEGFRTLRGTHEDPHNGNCQKQQNQHVTERHEPLRTMSKSYGPRSLA